MNDRRYDKSFVLFSCYSTSFRNTSEKSFVGFVLNYFHKCGKKYLDGKTKHNVCIIQPAVIFSTFGKKMRQINKTDGDLDLVQ